MRFGINHQSIQGKQQFGGIKRFAGHVMPPIKRAAQPLCYQILRYWNSLILRRIDAGGATFLRPKGNAQTLMMRAQG